jgi:hypothetical protein
MYMRGNGTANVVRHAADGYTELVLLCLVIDGGKA